MPHHSKEQKSKKRDRSRSRSKSHKKKRSDGKNSELLNELRKLHERLEVLEKQKRKPQQQMVVEDSSEVTSVAGTGKYASSLNSSSPQSYDDGRLNLYKILIEGAVSDSND